MDEEKVLGRPTKFTDEFIEAAKKVINEDDNALYLTDDDLRLLINEELPEKDRISTATFENYKAGKVADEEKYEIFLGLIKKALIDQKKRLLKKVETTSEAWQRYSWIIERKFDEWNIRNKSELDLNVGVTVDITE